MLQWRSEPMTQAAWQRRPFTSRERKIELERKLVLDLAEAAEFLDMAPKTLRNKLSDAKLDPQAAPKPFKRRGRLAFEVIELKRWEKVNPS